MPFFSHHNNIAIDNDDCASPFRPVIPPISCGILVVATSVMHHNNIRVAKREPEKQSSQLNDKLVKDEEKVSIKENVILVKGGSLLDKPRTSFKQGQ